MLHTTANADLFNPVQGEHFGIVPLEAMAAARPVIACNSGGPRESVLHGSTGFLCRPDPVAVAAAMAQLTVRSAVDILGILQVEQRRKLAKATREHYVEQSSILHVPAHGCA